MNPIAFNLFGIPIRWYGILISTAMLIGAILALREGKRVNIDEDYLLDIFLVTIPSAIIGARLYYVIFEWANYKDNLIKIFDIRGGGLAIHGGVLGAVIAGSIYAKKKNISFFKIADICAPSIILGQAIGRWGNFINQEAHGGPVSSEFISHFPEFIQKQMLIEGTYYHPTFLYESIWNLIVFIFLIIYRRKNKHNGYVFLLYTILYSIGRYFIEGLRTDSLMMGSLRTAQVVSILLIVLSIIGMFIIKRKDDRVL